VLAREVLGGSIATVYHRAVREETKAILGVGGTLAGLILAVLLPMRSDIRSVRDDVSGLRDDVSDLRDEMSGIKNELSRVQDDVSGIKDEVSSLRDEVSGVKGELSRVKERLARVEENVDWLKNEQVRKAVAGVQSDSMDWGRTNVSGADLTPSQQESLVVR